MLLLSLAALAIASSIDALPRATFESVVPRMPGGYGPGRVAIQVHTVPVPAPASPALVGDLIARSGVAITETQGVRIEVTLPEEVRFESLEARVVDGLVLESRQRSFFGHVGDALLSLLRILVVGRLISATDELTVPGAAWAAALGAPDAEEELVRLATSESLRVERDAPTFSDHGRFVVCRSVIALSPWTELVDIKLSCRDEVSGKPVAFLIPRLALHDYDTRDPDPELGWQWVLADR
jgi:hypothetical protein